MQPEGSTCRSLIFVRYSDVEALIMAQRRSKSTVDTVNARSMDRSTAGRSRRIRLASGKHEHAPLSLAGRNFLLTTAPFPVQGGITSPMNPIAMF
jgi:hypothetical protein